MKKRILAIALAMAMSISVIPSDITYASDFSGTKDVSIMDMINPDNNSTNEIYCLFVTGTNLPDYHKAVAKTESGGVSLLKFSTKKQMENAYSAFQKEGYTVYKDAELSSSAVDADSISFNYDALNQFGTTVKDSTGTVTLSLSPEVMGLSISSTNITDAARNQVINNVGVAVIDSGIDASSFNSKFSNRLMSGYNVLANSNNTSDDYGHGTFIASIIANNTPSNVKIIPIKAVDSSGSFTASRLASALQYIVSNPNGINAVNLSLSICSLDSTQMDQVSSFINPYIDALYAKGILVITSAGNKNSNYPNMTADDSYPANYEKVVAVSGMAYSNNSWGAYSQSLSGNCVDYTAPAKFIRGLESSTMNMTKATAENKWSAEYLDLGDGTCVMSGTSQATAFVTAAAAQIYSYDTNYTAAEVDNILSKNATKTVLGNGVGKDSLYGYGYPEMSAYVYNIGSYNSSSKAYAGLVTNFDVITNNTKGTVTLMKYTGSSENVTVPSSYVINGRTYNTVLGKSTSTSGPFSGNTKIKTVEFADGVTLEGGNGSYLFYGCTNLASVNRIPSNAKDISYMFYECENLMTLPDVPGSVTKMDYAFFNCKKASGKSNILFSNVSSAKDAYTGCKVEIVTPANSTTYKTIKNEIKNYGGATLSGMSSSNTNGTNTASKKYTVVFNYRNLKVNKNGVTQRYSVASGKTISKPKNPTLAGYYFSGWYTSTGKKYNFSSKITKNMTLYAKWISKKVKKTSIHKLTKISSNLFAVTNNKVSGATGYEIQYTRHKNFQNFGVVRTSKLTRNVHVLHSGTIYVRVRAYKVLGGKRYYGSYSSIKKIKLD